MKRNAKKTQFLKKKREASVAFIIFCSVLIFEVFSGALRYYFTQWGFSSMIYIPKVACLLAVVIKIMTMKMRTFLPFIFFLVSVLVSLFNSASLFNIGFAIFVYCPFLFGLLYGEYLEIKKKELGIILWICFLSSILGIYLDCIIALPWKGFSYNIGGIEIEANRQWSTLGEDRVAGFSRLSASLAFMIAIFSIYIYQTLKSTFFKFLLFTVTFSSIVLTTNKTAVLSYFGAIMFYFFYKQKNRSKLFLFTITGIGCFLPIVSIFLNYSVSTSEFGLLSQTLLFSLDDRLTNTWPYFYEVIIVNNGLVFGTGIGTIGSSFSAFPIKSILTLKGFGLGVADNTFLYLWGMFGLVGLWLYTRFFALMYRLLNRVNSFSISMCAIVVCICIISWTTDIFEAVVSSLFLGVAGSVGLKKQILK
ncbi:hypothetical protein ACWA1F_22115 [Flavobacterium sp. 3-218]